MRTFDLTFYNSGGITINLPWNGYHRWYGSDLAAAIAAALDVFALSAGDNADDWDGQNPMLYDINSGGHKYQIALSDKPLNIGEFMRNTSNLTPKCRGQIVAFVEVLEDTYKLAMT